MNVIDPFVDRTYGPNLDPEREEDQRFIDAVAQLDDAALDLGLITPTHLIGSFRARPCTVRYPRTRSPELVVRPPGLDAGPFSPGALMALETRLAERERELERAWALFHGPRGRKAVRAALPVADFLRHPFRYSRERVRGRKA